MEIKQDLKKSELLGRIKAEILSLEPKAEIILYGSRARGDAREDSDWDLLILLEGLVDKKREDRIDDILFKIELETENVLVSIIRSLEKWNLPYYKATPFHKNVLIDGMKL